ncbi:MAG: helix-turn-helix domain-containing protein, partial [Patescibacteria group bacterium]
MTQLLEKNLVSTKEASEFSGYHSDYLARMARSGKIDGVQVGRTWLVSRESVEKFIADQDARKREIADSLARTREEEYKKLQAPLEAVVVTPEVVAIVEDSVVVDLPLVSLAQTETVLAQIPKFTKASIPSPYVRMQDVIARHALATFVTLLVIGTASITASSNLLPSVIARGNASAIALHTNSVHALGALVNERGVLTPLHALAVIGDATNTLVASSIVRAPAQYEGIARAWVDTSLALLDGAQTTELALGTHAGTLAYDVLTPHESSTKARVLPVLASDTSDVIAAHTSATASVASPLEALSSFSFNPSGFFVRAGTSLARATYRTLFGAFDFAGYVVATIVDPYRHNFPVITMREPQTGGNTSVVSTTTLVTYTGDTTVVQNISNPVSVNGVTPEYVAQVIELLNRSVERRFERRSSSAGGGLASIPDDLSIVSLIVSGDTDIGNNLTVGGDATITGTLSVGAFTVSTLSVTGPIVAPYFTATSTTATSSFAGGIYGKRIEAGDYLAGPYVLATSTTATSVFSGNIAVGR